MGQRTWMKYLGIVTAFTNVGGRIFTWLTQAQAASSPGGVEITVEEVPALQDVITAAVNEGLYAAGVPIVASISLTYIGEGD